jgi:hypothetical protein
MNSRFRRKLGERRYKRMFVIVAEGTVTEQEYFALFNDESIVHIKCLRHRHNLPPKDALKQAHDYIREQHIRKRDEVWVVVDRDSWLEKHLSELHAWSQTSENYGFALSNPKFEYWLLLHFEDATGISSGDDCNTRLHKYLPKYNKHINTSDFTRDRIKEAAKRARKRDTPACTDWPRSTGTTLYRLVEKILQEPE